MDKPEQTSNYSEWPNLRTIGCVSTLLSNIKKIEGLEKWEFGKKRKEKEAERRQTDEIAHHST